MAVINAEENAGLLDFTYGIDIKKLDFFLYLSSPVFKKVSPSRLELLYTGACEYGSFLAKRYPFSAYESKKAAHTLGAVIIPYDKKDLCVCRDKAYYEPFSKEIHWNHLFPLRLLKEKEALNFFKDVETIRGAVLTHELFHHIEEHLEVPADEYLRRIHKGWINPIFREIAAFSFTNKKITPLYSQFIDLFQLKIENPQYYTLCITKCR